jgi:hypothetical protein
MLGAFHAYVPFPPEAVNVICCPIATLAVVGVQVRIGSAAKELVGANTPKSTNVLIANEVVIFLIFI